MERQEGGREERKKERERERDRVETEKERERTGFPVTQPLNWHHVTAAIFC
jgi:hypothetical protein